MTIRSENRLALQERILSQADAIPIDRVDFLEPVHVHASILKVWICFGFSTSVFKTVRHHHEIHVGFIDAVHEG